MKGVGLSQTEQLVTDNERIAKLHELLGSRFSNHGKLLVPTFSHYESLNDDAGLLLLAKVFFRWIGFKPHELAVSYDTISQPYIVSENTIKIDSRFKEHPLVVGGLLTMAVLEFVMQHHKYQGDDRFIEVASVETGLGLWIINALQPRRSWREKMYHMIDGAWLQLEGIRLNAMTPAEYIRQFSMYVSQHRLFPESYAIGVSKRNHYLLPSTPGSERIRPMPEPSTTRQHIMSANAMWLRLALFSLIIGTVTTVAIFLWTQRPQPVPVSQINDEHALKTIKESLNTCINKASEQLSNYDPNDIFMARQVDATKSRCESLRNQYNQAVDNYSKTYLNNN